MLGTPQPLPGRWGGHSLLKALLACHEEASLRLSGPQGGPQAGRDRPQLGVHQPHICGISLQGRPEQISTHATTMPPYHLTGLGSEASRGQDRGDCGVGPPGTYRGESVWDLLPETTHLSGSTATLPSLPSRKEGPSPGHGSSLHPPHPLYFVNSF